MPRVVDENERRQEIRLAARRVFSERGLPGTGLAHVAAAAGMSRANLYHYYPDQVALVRDLADELLGEEAALFGAALEQQGSPLERIERLTGAVTDLCAQWADVSGLLLQIWARDQGRLRSLLRGLRDDLSSLVREGQRQGEIDRRLDPELAAGVVVALIDGLLLQFLVDPDAFPDPGAMRRTLIGSVRRTLAP
jgi:AcrR family transcriptional regulator